MDDNVDLGNEIFLLVRANLFTNTGRDTKEKSLKPVLFKLGTKINKLRSDG